jgi:hypothetical protein
MKFHEYETQKARAIGICSRAGQHRKVAKLKKMSPREALRLKAQLVRENATSALELLYRVTEDRAVRAPAIKEAATAELDLRLVAAELDWFDAARPFYNVFPIVEKLTTNTKLTAPYEKLTLPQSVLCFRFARGHEPFGIKTALVRVGETESANTKNCALTRFVCGEPVAASLFFGLFNTTEPNVDDSVYVFDVCQPDTLKSAGINASTIDDVLRWITREDSTFQVEDNKLYTQRVYFLSRLTVLATLIAAGNDLITPALLPSDQDKYAAETDEAVKRWMEERAAKIQGRGFDFGKELQAKSETCPHWRNPHGALYWTGPGGRVPVVKVRQGVLVKARHLTAVPTGVDCPIIEQAADTRPEYVYFLRDPSQGLVKIGRTRRSIAERQQESSTFVPNGLTLLGYIETGDCVEMETRIHREQSDKRRANEFFELAAAEVKAILVAYGGTATDHLE